MIQSINGGWVLDVPGRMMDGRVGDRGDVERMSPSLVGERRACDWLVGHGIFVQ